MILERPDWQEKAACRGVPTEIFFPDNPGGQDNVYNKAREFCQRCEVRTPCLAYALEHETGQRCRYGVFGGLSPRERYALGDGANPVRIRK
jgi:WhiB family redox-sensing transcriptional regulator